ncbi:outer membrane porin HofQ [Citrobacter braakii]|nr:outer membrane porin HofQ [Citrobacter braakii]
MVGIQSVLAAKSQNVTLVVDDVPVVQVLQALAEQEKKNLVVSPDVSGVLSLHLTDVSWKQALQTVVKSAGLVLRQEGNILHVHSVQWQSENAARQDNEQARLQASMPLEHRSIILQYADASELAKAGEKLLSAKGSMTVDKRTNRLLLRDNSVALNALETWVAQMDLPVAQVELAAHIVTINEKSLRELGVKWSLADAQQSGAVGTSQRLPAIFLYPQPHPAWDLTLAILTVVYSSWSCLRWSKNSSWTSSPVHAYWLLTCNLPVLSREVRSLIRSPAVKAARHPSSSRKLYWGMEVTPTVLQKGRIRLKLHISQNVPGQVLQQADGEVLAIDKQEIETQVEVKSGETIALGGIFSHKNKSAADSVPLLGDIPWLGSLFRHDGKEDETA